MGKKSKRKGGGSASTGAPSGAPSTSSPSAPKTSTAPSSRGPLEETADNLRFEDPFEDEFGDDDMEIVDEQEQNETTPKDVTPNETPQKQGEEKGHLRSEGSGAYVGRWAE